MQYKVALWIDGLEQKGLHSIANALELHLSCTRPLEWSIILYEHNVVISSYAPNGNSYNKTILYLFWGSVIIHTSGIIILEWAHKKHLVVMKDPL